MTTDDQKSVNQLVHEASDLVAAATNAVAIAHAEARAAEALATAMDGVSVSLVARVRRIAMATRAAQVNGESAVEALQRLERRLAQTVSKPKQSDDGWIEWSGGDCPVPRETIVEVRYRDELGPEPSGNTRDWFMADRALAAEREAAGGHADPNLPPGEYGVTVDTVGGAATVNAGAAAGDRSAWLAGYRACADTVQSYRAHYDWGPKATAQDGADLATQSIKDVVARSLAREEGASVQTSERFGISGDIPADQDALLRTLRASLAGAEQERDQAIAIAEAAAEFAKADGAEITAWRTQALRAEAERDAASAHASGGVAAIAAERCRQTEVEGWTIEHDDAHGRRDMPRAAACYAWVASLGDVARDLMGRRDEWNTMTVFRALWPWDRKWWKPTDRRRDLVKAGALIAAEIDRLDRQSAREAGALIAAEIARLDRQSAREAEAAEAPADHLAAFEPGWWRPWGGGECPKDAIGKKVDVLRRSGAKAFGTLAIGGLRAVEGSWHHRNRDDDIVAYRVGQEKE